MLDRHEVQGFGYALPQRNRWSQSPGLRPRPPVRVRPLSRSRLASADLFGQGDDDARGAAEVTEQEDALVLCHLAEEFGAVGAQAGDGVMVPACLLLDGPADLPQMPPEGV